MRRALQTWALPRLFVYVSSVCLRNICAHRGSGVSSVREVFDNGSVIRASRLKALKPQRLRAELPAHGDSFTSEKPKCLTRHVLLMVDLFLAAELKGPRHWVLGSLVTKCSSYSMTVGLVGEEPLPWHDIEKKEL